MEAWASWPWSGAGGPSPSALSLRLSPGFSTGEQSFSFSFHNAAPNISATEEAEVQRHGAISSSDLAPPTG